MIKPKRITRKRTKGWRMPPNTKYVGRPSKYGNPFKLIGDQIYCDASHRRKILDPWVLFTDQLFDPLNGDRAIVFFYRHWLAGLYDSGGIVRPRGFTLDEMERELKGKNIACWCKQGTPCHGQVILDYLYGEDGNE